MNILSIYFSHDSNICIRTDDGKYHIYELERLTKKRYYHGAKDPDFEQVLQQLKTIIETDTGITRFDTCIYAQTPEAVRLVITKLWGCTNFIEMPHHPSHIAGAVHLSPFDKCLVLSCDAGGWDDGTVNNFVIAVCEKDIQSPIAIGAAFKILNSTSVPLDVCSAYTLLAAPIAEINKTSLDDSYLSLAGKVMGLAAYGHIRDEWIPALLEFYWGNIDSDQMRLLGNRIGIDLSGINTLGRWQGRDLAATSQHVFNAVVFHAIAPFIYKQQLPIVITGGGALNVVFNQYLKQQIKWPVFVPPNPSDCGLAFGQLIYHLKAQLPETTTEITYSGFEILDLHQLPEYIEKYNPIRIGNANELAELLNDGKIIGFMGGGSEVGARALGNRSIMCVPGKGMKDKINARIKHREGYRPFAPIIREEDAASFFIAAGPSPYMSFNYDILPSKRRRIPSVCHDDGTARVQTINEKQHEFLYTLLTCLHTLNGEGILLNTSLNIKGKPIITTIADAIEILNTTEIDAICINGYLFEKNRQLMKNAIAD